MENIEDTILGMLFWKRSEDYDNQEEYNKMRKEYAKKANTKNDEKNILKLFKDNVKDEKKVKELQKLFLQYTNHLLYELSFESLFFYKVGFKDGYKFYGELNNLNSKKERQDNIYQNVNEEMERIFCEFFEKERQKLIKENEKYRNLHKIKKEYIKKYPNVVKAIEDGEGDYLNAEEIKVLSELFSIELDISTFESIFAFKMGERNAIKLF